MLLYKTKYQGVNFIHFIEYLYEDENIKVPYNFVYKLLTSVGIISPKSKKK